jgi:hypothetical protein
VRVFLCGIGAAILGLCAQLSLFAQAKAVAGNLQQMSVSVPFIGCRSDGQVGPVEAPEEPSASVPISPRAAEQLAYYRSAQGIGILAPRGWHCFGTYGSGGDALSVNPEPIDAKDIFSSGRIKFAGPAIQVSRRFGYTSGRFSVAEIIARVFPAYKPFVTSVMKDFDQPPGSFPFGPYPTDTLTYKSKTVVEYRTPAQTDGLGTYSWLEKSGDPIDGVAILVGQTPDLLLLEVRLPRDLDGLAAAIIGQFERDAARLPQY